MNSFINISNFTRSIVSGRYLQRQVRGEREGGIGVINLYQCAASGEQIIIDNMFFADYSQFLQSEGQLTGYLGVGSNGAYSESVNFLKSQALAAQHDAVYSQFTQTIGKRLIAQPYPHAFNNHNPYCPLCLRFVKNEQIVSTCYINQERNYLIHSTCLEVDKNYPMRNVGEIHDNTFQVEEAAKSNSSKFEFGLDSRVFYVEVALTHPISQKSFIKISKRVNLVRNHFTISFNEEEQQSFFPNIVALPLTDFQLTVSVAELGSRGPRAKYTKYLALKNIKDKRRIKVESEDIWFQAEIIQDKTEKNGIFQKMNYKYKFGGEEDLPLLRILNFSIKLPEQFQQSQQEQYIIQSNSTIVQELLNQKQPSALSTIKSSCASPLKHRVCSSDSNNSSQQLSHQSQKVNLQKLITTHTLIEFVKNNTQSRFFQNYLAEASQAEVQQVLQHIKPHIVQLIMHEYGNYMVQKLFTVCHPYQRLDLLQTLLPDLYQLIRNKQGTHTLQTFIGHFSLHEQFSLICFQLREQYYQLCTHNNATHFIQKVIKTFPLQYTLPYFHYTTQNLLAFALDKNAMCVIKHMMRRFRQLEGKEGQNYQNLQHIRRQLVTQVTFSVDKLIMDSYGNYVIQFCYELFDLERCVGITERILSRFHSYAIGKFSSNVLLKCIATYWVDKQVYTSLRALGNTQIVEIFRNKDGNKILMEIMEKLQGTELWDRLYSTLIRVQPTRYYHDRWGVCLGSRSGQVGSHFTGFPQPKKKNYRNNRKI